MSLIDSYSQIGVSCFSAPLSKVRDCVQERLAAFGLRWPFHISTAPAQPRRIYELSPPAGGAHATRIMLFSPSLAPDTTAMLVNLADSWSSLVFNVSKHLPCKAFRFDMGSEQEEWPAYRVTVWDKGEVIRWVHLLRDSHAWQFWQKGRPLRGEDKSAYTKSRTKERMSREGVVRIATKWGFPIGDDRFWESRTEAVYIEQEQSERPQPEGNDAIAIPSKTEDPQPRQDRRRRDDLLDLLERARESSKPGATLLVSVDAFFEGNDDEGSIGCNLDPHPGLERFRSVLKGVRDRPEVQDVFVGVSEVPDRDDDSWPFSESVFVLTSAPRSKVATWMRALEPDEVDAPPAGLEVGPLPTSRPGMKLTWIWWD